MRRLVIVSALAAVVAGTVGQALALPVHRGPCAPGEKGVMTGVGDHKLEVCITEDRAV